MFSCSCFTSFYVFLSFLLWSLVPISAHVTLFPLLPPPPPPSVVETVQSNVQVLLDSGPTVTFRCQETISETCIPVPVLNWQEGFLKATPTTLECV